RHGPRHRSDVVAPVSEHGYFFASWSTSVLSRSVTSPNRAMLLVGTQRAATAASSSARAPHRDEKAICMGRLICHPGHEHATRTRRPGGASTGRFRLGILRSLASAWRVE